jgi:integrase
MNLTEKAISSLKATEKRQHFYDDEGGGFGVRIEAAHLGGRANFFWRAKVNGQVFYKSLGECGIVPLKQARDNARTLAGKAITWKAAGYPADQNPFIVKNTAKANVAAKCPTFLELREAYLLHHVREHANRPDKAEIRVLQLSKYMKAWNDRAVDSITVEDVLAVKNAQGKHQHTANRIVEFLRALFNWSAKSTDGKINFWKVENPATDVSRYKEAKRERFLLPQELARFNEALKNEPDADLRDFIVISLNTGARRGDVLSMRWADILWEANSWRVPKPKNDTPYEVALLPVVMASLKRRRAEIADDKPFVFPSHGRTGHLDDVKKRWQEFRKRAGVPDVRVHDLRRTCGSYLAMSGVGLPAVGQALGHKSLASTQIYARFDTTAVRNAREQGQATMVTMMRKAQRRVSARKSKVSDRKPKLLTNARQRP